MINILHFHLREIHADVFFRVPAIFACHLKETVSQHETASVVLSFEKRNGRWLVLAVQVCRGSREACCCFCCCVCWASSATPRVSIHFNLSSSFSTVALRLTLPFHIFCLSTANLGPTIGNTQIELCEDIPQGTWRSQLFLVSQWDPHTRWPTKKLIFLSHYFLSHRWICI